MATLLEQLRDSQNRRDVKAMSECFDPGYQGEQPAHPNRGFGGKEQVGKNLSTCSRAFPTSRPSCYVTAPTGVWGEWNWRATGLRMTGVTVMGVKEGRISWARLYMEPVEEAGQDIDEAVETITERDRPGNRQMGALRT